MFEVFLWTDERDPIYFEYEISPLDRELPILVPNLDGKFLGWLPWHYEGDAQDPQGDLGRSAASVKSGAEVKGWTAEVFIPYELLTPLRNVPPKPGTRWRANFYRMDYDDGKHDELGLGPRRPELPRVPEVRHAGVRVSAHRTSLRP